VYLRELCDDSTGAKHMTKNSGQKKKTASWGLCKDCKWWQIEPDASVESTTMGLCIDEDLYPYKMRISGNGGCNRFMEGKPARAKGSSGQPPTAKPQR
jgi:hypothetical protein